MHESLDFSANQMELKLKPCLPSKDATPNKPRPCLFLWVVITSMSSPKLRKKPPKTKPLGVSHLDLCTQLLEAIQQGKPKIVKRILDNRVDTNCTTSDGEAPLLLACSLQNEDARRAISILLVDRGCQIDQSDKKGQTPLMIAIMNQDTQLVNFLLEKGATVTLADHHGNNALCHSAMTGNKDILQKVLQECLRSKLDVDQKNMRGQTPLLLAAQNGHLEAAKILVEKGKASLTIRDLDNFMTPEEWMKCTSFYSASELLFLSPRKRHKQIKKKVKTLADYITNDVTSSSDGLPDVYKFKLPQITPHKNANTSMSEETSTNKSMFAMPSIKPIATPLGKPVPITSQTKFSIDQLPRFQRVPKINYDRHKVVPHKSSKFYSAGSLEPLSSPLGRMDSITEDVKVTKRSMYSSNK